MISYFECCMLNFVALLLHKINKKGDEFNQQDGVWRKENTVIPLDNWTEMH